mmetsp:Transcript_4577/g.16402  ORF Transcript_4577/g.16402 Transcript_4577/m.16402 type:complete len:234 (+) Transcript_4577:2189-2890(+)
MFAPHPLCHLLISHDIEHSVTCQYEDRVLTPNYVCLRHVRLRHDQLLELVVPQRPTDSEHGHDTRPDDQPPRSLYALLLACYCRLVVERQPLDLGHAALVFARATAEDRSRISSVRRVERARAALAALYKRRHSCRAALVDPRLGDLKVCCQKGVRQRLLHGAVRRIAQLAFQVHVQTLCREVRRLLAPMSVVHREEGLLVAARERFFDHMAILHLRAIAQVAISRRARPEAR